MAAMDELISGAMVRSHIEALRTRIGDREYDTLVATLPTDHVEELMLVTPLSWVRIGVLEALYGVLAPSVGMTVADLHSEIAARVVGKAVTTIWRALLHFASDGAIVARAPVIFKRAYKQGRLEVIRTSPGSADLRITDWPDMSDFALRGFRIGLESTLRSAGRREPKGTSREVEDGAIISLEWVVA
jgi:hypothetical protein